MKKQEQAKKVLKAIGDWLKADTSERKSAADINVKKEYAKFERMI